MLIQDETPLPVDPLASLATDYEHAVVHMAWALRKKIEEPRLRLLLAWVELLPIEVPPPEDDGYIEAELGSRSEHRLYVRHAVAPAARALRWYLACRDGIAILPERDGLFPEADQPKAIKAQLGDMGEEPPWPNLVCVDDRKTWAPFCPAWHKTPRVHHLVPLVNPDLEMLWPKEHKRRKAIAFLSERLHFDLGDHTKYVGSVHLVAPNPVFRELDVRREPRGDDGRERVAFRFRPRTGRDLGALELSVREDRPSGVGALHCVHLRQPVVRMTFDHKTYIHSETVKDPARGVLYTSKNGLFVDSVSLGISIGPSVTRTVRATDGSSYEVPLEHPTSEPFSAVQGGKPSKRLTRMPSANLQRHARVRAGNQKWFSGVREEARRVLRELLFEAKREVLIVDFYFGAAELTDFVLAVRAIEVPIHILTSAEVLKKKMTPAIKNGEALLAELGHVSTQPYANKMAIRVMVGGRPTIHDRFFVIDERVWLLGSSLNEFGSRGTMMVALPDPAPVRERLIEAWCAAKELEPWLEAHKARKSEQDGAQVPK